MNIPQITVQSVSEIMQSKDQFVILDVREYWEMEKVSLVDDRVIVLPMSQIVHNGLDAIPDEVKNTESEIIIICLRGIRSAQAIGCLGMRACHTTNCPVGIATQKESLRQRIIVESSAKQLSNFLIATNDLMKVIARACGYDDFKKFNKGDLATFNRDIHHLTGLTYAGTN